MNDDARLLTPDEAAHLMGVTRRRALKLPIRQVRLGHRTIRFRRRDLYEYLGIEDAGWRKDDGE